MRRHISLPNLQQAGGEAGARSVQYRLYQDSPAVSIPDLLLLQGQAGHHGFLQPCRPPPPPQKERKGMFLKKGKKSAALSRDFYNKYEKRKSVNRFLMKNPMKISSPERNLLSMSRLSKSETSLVRPTDMFMLR